MFVFCINAWKSTWHKFHSFDYWPIRMYMAWIISPPCIISSSRGHTISYQLLPCQTGTPSYVTESLFTRHREENQASVPGYVNITMMAPARKQDWLDIRLFFLDTLFYWPKNRKRQQPKRLWICVLTGKTKVYIIGCCRRLLIVAIVTIFSILLFQLGFLFRKFSLALILTVREYTTEGRSMLKRCDGSDMFPFIRQMNFCTF